MEVVLITVRERENGERGLTLGGEQASILKLQTAQIFIFKQSVVTTLKAPIFTRRVNLTSGIVNQALVLEISL